MKKILIILLVVAMAAGLSLILASCADAIIPATQWAKTEKLTYDIKEGGEKTGELVIELTEIATGESVSLPSFGDKQFKITSEMKGVKYIQTAFDLDGKEIMRSESVINGFNSLASYKKIKTEGKETEYKSYLDGKNYKVSINGGAEEKVKPKKNNVDNEFLYGYLRIYNEINSGYSQEMSVLDPFTGEAAKLKAAASTAREEADVNYIDGAGSSASKKVKLIPVVISRSEAPIGKTMTVYFTDKDFIVYGDASLSPTNRSRHLPYKIVENNLEYVLTLAEIK